MKRLLLLLPLLAFPALGGELSETKLSVNYENVAFTDVLADIESKMNVEYQESRLTFSVRLDRSVTNEIPAITLRAAGIALEELLSELDSRSGLDHA